ILGFKHNAGGFGTLGTLASDAETSRGPISLHTAIGEGAGGGRSIRFKAKSGHYPFLALFSGERGRGILRTSSLRSSRKLAARSVHRALYTQSSRMVHTGDRRKSDVRRTP